MLCHKRASGPWFRGLPGQAFSFFLVLRIVVFSRASNIRYAGIKAKAKEYSGFKGVED